MKNNLIIILLSILPYIGLGQQFVYNYTNSDTNYTDNYILSISSNNSYFTEENAILNRKYLKVAHHTGKVDMNNMKRSSKMNIVVSKLNDENFLFNSFGAKVIVEIKPLEWKINKETKTINGKILNQATTNYGGRDWIAWYNLKIPIQDGPYVFRGLPGLIEEIYDKDNIHSFILRGKSKLFYKTEFLSVQNPSVYTKFSMAEYLNLVEKAKENPFEFSKNNSNIFSMIDIEITPEMQKSYNIRALKILENYIIERPERTN